MKRHRFTFRRQWSWPIGLAELTIFGLLSALLGEGGIWRGLAWAALAIPLLVIARHVLRPAGRPHHARHRAP